MSVWGHNEVYVVKNVDDKTWDVFTSKPPRQLLVTIKWADALRNIPHASAPDFVEAVAACRSSETTDLTIEEEEDVLAELEGRKKPTVEPKVVEAPKTPKNVISLDAFRKKKR